MALDERLRRQLEEAGQPADPSGVYEDLIRRHERRRRAKQLKATALTVGVIAATLAGVVALSNVFEPSRTSPGDDPEPLPVAPLRNGRIAYSLSGSGGMELHTILPDGSGDQIVPTPPGLPSLPAWSPDGSQLAVAIFPTGGGPRAIWVLDADGSDARRIGSAENVSVPSWSPDGSSIAYSATSAGWTEIRIVSPDGTGERVIHREGAEGTFAIFSAKFSPDGQEILFDRGTDSRFDIFVMDVDGTNVRPLTTTGSDYDPHWSPDGSKILFTRQGAGAQSDIYVMDVDGTNVQQLTEGGEGTTNLYPNWAPDGTAIAYVAGVTGGPGPLVVMNPDGSEPSTLVEGEVLGIAWQPLPATPIEPIPSPTPGPSFGGDLCNLSSVDGDFVADGTTSTVFVATRRGDTGGCPQPEGAYNVIALDEDADGIPESSYGPIECELECRTFSAPDIDGDGTDELLIVQGGGAIVATHLYDVRMDAGRTVIVPVNVAGLGPQGSFEPDDSAVFLLGGDAFELHALRCGDIPAPDGPGIVATSAESVPHDSPDAEWHAHEVTLVLRDDGVMHVVDVRDFTEPVTADSPAFVSGKTLCGSNLGP